MPHRLVVGMTESGKSTLMKLYAAGFKKRGIHVAVLDPLKSPDWKADYITDDSAAFLRYAQSRLSCALFVDEGSQAVGRYNQPMEWLTTQSRHWGHECHLICQSRIQLSPIVRDQCGELFVFATSVRETEAVADEYRESSLRSIEKFKPGEFFKLTRFGPRVRGRVNFKKKTVTFFPVAKPGRNAA